MTKEDLGNLIIASRDSLYRISRTILDSDADCEDAVSAMIVQCFKHYRGLREDDFAKTWMTRILINECYALLRKRREYVGIETDVAQAAAQDEGKAAFAKGVCTISHDHQGEYSDLYEAIRSLAEPIRTTIVLFYIEGYSIREIAASMRCEEGTVKSRLSRGRARLKQFLE